jgi:hypothetical protein
MSCAQAPPRCIRALLHAACNIGYPSEWGVLLLNDFARTVDISFTKFCLKHRTSKLRGPLPNPRSARFNSYSMKPPFQSVTTIFSSKENNIKVREKLSENL